MSPAPKAPPLLFGMDPKSIPQQQKTVSVKIADVARRCHISRQAIAKWGVRSTERGMIDALEAIEVLHLQATNARESAPVQRKSADRIEDAKADLLEAKRDKVLRNLVEGDRFIDVISSIVGAAVYELQQLPHDLLKGQILTREQADELNKRLERTLTKISTADWKGELRFADADFAALDQTEEADPDFPGFDAETTEEESD
jgi:hypothetical protein